MPQRELLGFIFALIRCLLKESTVNLIYHVLLRDLCKLKLHAFFVFEFFVLFRFDIKQTNNILMSTFMVIIIIVHD